MNISIFDKLVIPLLFTDAESGGILYWNRSSRGRLTNLRARTRPELRRVSQYEAALAGEPRIVELCRCPPRSPRRALLFLYPDGGALRLAWAFSRYFQFGIFKPCCERGPLGMNLLGHEYRLLLADLERGTGRQVGSRSSRRAEERICATYPSGGCESLNLVDIIAQFKGRIQTSLARSGIRLAVDDKGLREFGALTVRDFESIAAIFFQIVYSAAAMSVDRTLSLSFRLHADPDHPRETVFTEAELVFRTVEDELSPCWSGDFRSMIAACPADALDLLIFDRLASAVGWRVSYIWCKSVCTIRSVFPVTRRPQTLLSPAMTQKYSAVLEEYEDYTEPPDTLSF